MVFVKLLFGSGRPMRKPLFFPFLLVILLSWPLMGQTCENASSIPAGHKKLGSGSATGHYDGTTIIKGGQSAYVKIKNENVLGVSYSLTIEQDATPSVPNCRYKAILPPRSSAILYGALFADPPIGWKITVSVGDESDAGVITYEVYSKPPPTSSSPKRLQSKN